VLNHLRLLVRPETVLRWHRDLGERLVGAKRAAMPRPRGRPGQRGWNSTTQTAWPGDRGQLGILVEQVVDRSGGETASTMPSANGRRRASASTVRPTRGFDYSSTSASQDRKSSSPCRYTPGPS
jgi:hypothetical protein